MRVYIRLFLFTQGSGTLNGTSGYTFLVTGVDGGGIRVQITNSSNSVVYDTQPGAATNRDAYNFCDWSRQSPINFRH